MKADKILTTAADIVSGPRQALHGPEREDFEKIAIMWDAYFLIRRNPTEPLSAADVAQMMSLLKKARAQCGVHNDDDHIDDAGYSAIAGELATPA